MSNVQAASIDHAMWFHRAFKMDQWLLYVCEGVTSSGARGLARAYVPWSVGGYWQGRQWVQPRTIAALLPRQGWAQPDRVLGKPLGVGIMYFLDSQQGAQRRGAAANAPCERTTETTTGAVVQQRPCAGVGSQGFHGEKVEIRHWAWRAGARG